jgi:ADP-heptose:LPS heptosyltransferase
MPRHYALKPGARRTLVRALDSLGDVLAPVFRSGNRPPSLKNLLILRLDHLGDVICALPLLKRLAALPNRPRISIAVSSAAAPLLRDVPWVDEVLTWNAPWFVRQPSEAVRETPAAFAKRIKAKTFDVSIDLRGDARHHWLLMRAGLPFRVGVGNTGLAFLLHREIPWAAERHVIDENLAVLEALGLPKASGDQVELPWTPQPDESAWIAARGVRPDAVVFHVDAGTSAKQWPVSHWAALIERLGAGERAVLVGRSRDLGDRVQAALGWPLINLAGQTSLPQLVSLLQGASSVVTTDSGPAHIAAALGRSTFVVWSGTNQPSRWLPRGKSVRFLRHNVSCQPCGLERCARERHYCMEDLTPDAAAAEASELFAMGSERS